MSPGTNTFSFSRFFIAHHLSQQTCAKCRLSKDSRFLYPLTDESWGVRRFFVKDPGCIIGNVLGHKGSTPPRLDIEIKDRFGNPVIPREWFLVPLFVIDDAVEKIKDGTITGGAQPP